MGVIPTVIVQPRVLANEVERQRIAELFEAIDRSRVVTVYAPAGYGKTTAALKWAQMLERAGRPVLWLAARAGIVDRTGFVAALEAAAKAADLDWPSLGGASEAELLTVLASSGDRKVALVIDDAQLLPPDVLALVTQIVASARDAITTIIVSRSRARIPIARLRALGYLIEVNDTDLRFTLAEAAEFVTRRWRMPVDTASVAQLHAETLGWPAGLVISTGSSEGHSQADYTATPRSYWRELESYFDEEVMSLEPPAMRDFLVDTAVLDMLDASSCAAVTCREQSRPRLEAAEEGGLFLERLDDEQSRFRYHPLFRKMILRRLYERDPARAAELHRRASRHMAAQGGLLEAINHAQLSGDQDFLVEQLETLAETLIYRGHLARIDDLISDLPPGALKDRPNLLLAMAWRRARGLAFASSASLIEQAEAAIERRREADGAGDPAIRHLGHVVEHRQIMLAAARDDMIGVERRAEALLAELGGDEPYLSCTLLAQLMAARRELYHFHDMLKLEAETRRALDRPGSDFASIALKASVAPTLIAQGKTDAAKTMLEEALALARTIASAGGGLASLPALPLAELLYDRNQLEAARALIDAHLPSARQWGFVDQIAAGHIIKARLLAADGDLESALKALEETHLLAIECGLDRLRAYVVSEQVRMLTRTGNLDRARAASKAGGLEPEGEPVPTMTPSRQHETVAITWLRLEMQEHRLVRARKVAKRWSEFVRRNGAVRSTVAFELLLAQIAILAGDRSEARRAVREAVTLAAPGGWLRMFIDEGDAIGSLLIEAYGHGPTLDSAPDQFAAHLVAAFGGSPVIDDDDEFGLASRLVNRELEILRMVGGGLRNREIGDRLGLTEGTVKWYMQQIYDKLGVRRRPQAVMRARQLGILG